MLIAARTIEDEDKHQMNIKKGRKMKGKQWAQKQLYGQFIRQATGKSSEYRRG